MKKRTLFIMILGFSFASPVLAAHNPEALVGENLVSDTTGAAVACPLQQELRKQEQQRQMSLVMAQKAEQEEAPIAGQAK